MLNEFIDKIVVHERERIDRYQYDQKVDIYFNFIGKIELPEDEADEAPQRQARKSGMCRTTPLSSLSANTCRSRARPPLRSPLQRWRSLPGKKLCASAFKYASYWYPSQDRPLSNVIYNAGYDVDRVDLKTQTVFLIKAA